MKRSIRFFSLILLFDVLQPSKCSDPGTKTLATVDTSYLNTGSPNFYLKKGNNETGYDSSKDNSTSESFTTVSSNTVVHIKSSINEGNDRQISMPELRNRVRRDDEDEEQPESSDTNESSQDDTSDPDQGPNMDDPSRSNDSESTEEEAEDSSSKNCNESESSQLEPGSMDVEDRDERSVKVSQETVENSGDSETLPPYWYRGPSFDKRYWSSYEREGSFIKIPVFPGK